MQPILLAQGQFDRIAASLGLVDRRDRRENHPYRRAAKNARSISAASVSRTPPSTSGR
jgi:hypothetical protein